jgi:hypothetical protein
MSRVLMKIGKLAFARACASPKKTATAVPRVEQEQKRSMSCQYTHGRPATQRLIPH